MSLREWYFHRSKFEILSTILIPILLLTIIILSVNYGSKVDDANLDTNLNRFIRSENQTVLNTAQHHQHENRCLSNECIKATNKFLNIIDSTVDPCDDFYQFVCGNFIKLDNDQDEISSFFDHYTNIVRKKLKRIVSESNNINDTNSLKLAKQLYQTCLLPNNETDWKIRKFIKDLGGWPLIEGNKWNEGNFSWIKTMIKARELGLNFNWLIRIVEDGYIMQINYPNDLLPSNENEKSLAKYLMKRIASYLFQLNEFNDTQIDEILQFEDKLVEIVEKVKLSDKNDNLFISVETLNKKWSSIDWLNLFNNITMRNSLDLSTIIMNNVELYLKDLLKLLDKTSNRTVADFITWKVLLELSPHMPKLIQNDVINYVSIRSKKMHDTSELCFRTVRFRMKNVLESEYYRRYKIKSFNSNPVLNKLIKEMKLHIGNNKWMDQSSKNKSIERFEYIKKMFGGYDNFQNATIFDRFNGYETFQFSSTNIIDMITELRLNEYQTKFSRIDTILYLRPRFGSFDWSLTNAAFLMGFNILAVGLGVLQDDFYKDGRPNYLNFGGIGWILSHELSHAFDNTYHKYLHRFNLIDWISEETLKEYNKRLECVINEHKQFIKTESQINVTKCLLEDLADFIAIDVTYEAYQRVKNNDLKLPNFNYNQNQLFWIQFSSFLCYKKTNTFSIMDNDKFHGLPKFRVNGPLRNSKYFAKDFNCASGTFMNPVQKCDLI